MRHSQLIASFAAAVVSGSVIAAQPALAPFLKAQIGGITLGDPHARVEEVLGKAEHVVETGDALGPELQYAGLSVWLWDGNGVAQIRSTSPKYCVVADICPGVDAARVTSALGPPEPEAHTGVSTYAVEAETCWLEVTVADDVVTALEIKCQP